MDPVLIGNFFSKLESCYLTHIHDNQAPYVANQPTKFHGENLSEEVFSYDSTHRRHEPILVTCKTLTKSSTYVKFVIKFVGTANLTNILNFREPLNN